MDPITAMKNRDRDLGDYDLMKYRQESPQIEVWMKEIKRFKQYIAEKANQFQVVPNYKELKLFSLKSRNYDSIVEEQPVKYMRKTISNRNFLQMKNEDYERGEMSKVNSRRTEDDLSDLENNGSYKRLSFGGREIANGMPVINEMQMISGSRRDRPSESQEE